MPDEYYGIVDRSADFARGRKILKAKGLIPGSQKFNAVLYRNVQAGKYKAVQK